MSRLHKKCFIASGGIHLLLALILITCPAFFAPKPRQSDVQPITFLNPPDILVDAPVSNPGGSSGGRAPAPTPPAPVPRTQTPLAVPPEPPREPLRPVIPQRTDTPSLEVTNPHERKKPQIDLSNLTFVVRDPKSKPPSRTSSTTDDREREQNATKQRIGTALRNAADNVGSGTGSAVRIDGNFSGTGTGPSYQSYGAWVWGVFDRAWVRPEDASVEDATVEASVTIASDGTVIAKRIIKRSGDAAVDASVQRVLDRVSTVERPFPEGAKDKQRTYIIPFNMKTTR